MTEEFLVAREYRHLHPDDLEHLETRLHEEPGLRSAVVSELRRALVDDPLCRRARSLAADLGLQIALELEPFPLSLVNSVETMVQFLDAVDHPAVAANIDDQSAEALAPALEALWEAGATVRGYDPEAMDEARRLLPEVTFCATPYEACDGADLGGDAIQSGGTDGPSCGTG
mgnify:CR=1 FL=1